MYHRLNGLAQIIHPQAVHHCPIGGSPQASRGRRDHDRSYGERVFNAWADRIDAAADKDLASTRTDIPRAANRALGLAAAVLRPAAYARLRALPAAEFEIANVDDLPALASMVLYVHEQAIAAGALADAATLSPELAQKSAVVEKRMQTLLEYHFADDLEIGPVLKDLAPGTSYRDRASDLLGYARLYDMRAAIVRADPKNYVPTDVEDARAYAAQIMAAIRDAETPKARLWRDRLAKAFTLLNAAYGEARATWLWLERQDSTAADRFPSLYLSPRAPKPRKPTAGDSQGGGGPPAA